MVGEFASVTRSDRSSQLPQPPLLLLIYGRLNLSILLLSNARQGMKTNNLHPQIYPRWLNVLAIFALASAGMTLWWLTTASQMENHILSVSLQPRLEQPKTATTIPREAVKAPTHLGPVATIEPMQAETYWVEVVGNEVILIPQPVTVAVGLSKVAILEQAFTELLEGQGVMGFSTIPEGTRLLDIAVKADGVHLNFSKEFAQGGGSTSMVKRVGQVIFTASSIDADEPVFIAVEGQPIDSQNPLGGEGLILTQPIMRREFVSQYPMY